MNQRLRTVLKTHRSDESLKTLNRVYAQTVFEHLLKPLRADIGADGDITTSAVLPGPKVAQATLIAKQAGTLAGMAELKFFLAGKRAGSVKILQALDDGVEVKRGAVLAVLEGNVADILKAERTVLNFLQHMCGVATLAHKYVQASRKYPVLVCPTRKTPWGLLDKRACLVAGAGTHRLGLSDAVLVKDTHLDLLRHDFKTLGQQLKSARKLGRFVEVEVESVAEARKAADMLFDLQKSRKIPCFIMLDNMKPNDIGKFVRELRSSKLYGKIFVEASGGINLKNIQQYAKTGVDILSVGAMTHSAPALDISLKIF